MYGMTTEDILAQMRQLAEETRRKNQMQQPQSPLAEQLLSGVSDAWGGVQGLGIANRDQARDRLATADDARPLYSDIDPQRRASALGFNENGTPYRRMAGLGEGPQSPLAQAMMSVPSEGIRNGKPDPHSFENISAEAAFQYPELLGREGRSYGGDGRPEFTARMGEDSLIHTYRGEPGEIAQAPEMRKLNSVGGGVDMENRNRRRDDMDSRDAFRFKNLQEGREDARDSALMQALLKADPRTAQGFFGAKADMYTADAEERGKQAASESTANLAEQALIRSMIESTDPTTQAEGLRLARQQGIGGGGQVQGTSRPDLLPPNLTVDDIVTQINTLDGDRRWGEDETEYQVRILKLEEARKRLETMTGISAPVGPSVPWSPAAPPPGSSNIPMDRRSFGAAGH